jgi:hypothetical protein
MAIERFTNDSSSTLNGAINNSVTSLDVTSAATFPSSPQFRIKIDTELLLVTGVAGTTFTVTRGVEGTTAASHSNGATVIHILTSGAVSRFKTDVYFITPPALAGNVDDYNPSGLSTARYVRLDGGAASRDITGLQAPADSQEVTFFNIGTTDNLVFKDESGSSSAANRFTIAGGDKTIAPKAAVTFSYDPTSTRWRAIL